MFMIYYYAICFIYFLSCFKRFMLSPPNTFRTFEHSTKEFLADDSIKLKKHFKRTSLLVVANDLK